MAYLNYLVSVPLADVEALRADPATPISRSLTVAVSHLVAYWVQVQPLGQLLGHAIDGGTVINPSLRHKLRDPNYHDPDTVRSLFSQLVLAWNAAISAEPIPDDDWYRIEIEKVLRLFAHAAEHGECVVSVLEPNLSIHFKPNE